MVGWLVGLLVGWWSGKGETGGKNGFTLRAAVCVFIDFMMCLRACWCVLVCVCSFVSSLLGRVLVGLVGCLLARLVGCFVVGLLVCLFGWLVGWLVGGCFVDRCVGWLIGCLVD